MPALTEAQRRYQQQMQRRTEQKNKAKNKPGQKGVPTSGGSATKSETIGGSKSKSKTTAKKSKDSAQSPIPASKDLMNSGSTDARFKPSAPSKPKPSPSAPRSGSSAPQRSSSSASTPSPSKAPSGGSKAAASSSDTYRDGGKGLYQGTKEYRDSVGGSGNPLLNRFRKDMGRDEGTGNITKPEAPKPGSAVTKDAPNGKPYYGPAYGERSGPAKPASPGDKKPDVGYKPKSINAPDYSSSKTTNRTGTAFGAKNNLLEELRKRRTGQ